MQTRLRMNPILRLSDRSGSELPNAVWGHFDPGPSLAISRNCGDLELRLRPSSWRVPEILASRGRGFPKRGSHPRTEKMSTFRVFFAGRATWKVEAFRVHLAHRHGDHGAESARVILRLLNAFDQRIGGGAALGYRVIEQFDSVSYLVHEALPGSGAGYNAGIIGHRSPFPVSCQYMRKRGVNWESGEALRPLVR
jgi:hypothetical protein